MLTKTNFEITRQDHFQEQRHGQHVRDKQVQKIKLEQSYFNQACLLDLKSARNLNMHKTFLRNIR